MVTSTNPQNDEFPILNNDASMRQSPEISVDRPGAGPNPAHPGAFTSTPPQSVTNHPYVATGTIAGRLRSASGKIFNSNIPAGMWDATGTLVSGAPSLKDIRRGSYGSDGWSGEGQLKDKDRRASLGRKGSTTQSPLVDSARPELNGHSSSQAHETLHEIKRDSHEPQASAMEDRTAAAAAAEPEQMGTGIKAFDLDPALKKTTEPFDNGYQFPPKHTWTEATMIGLKAFWKFTWTPLGFFVVLYGLLVVAFGGMLFLLLCNAAPAMCKPDCNDINSPRRIWVEYDSQIVNALFCVTGFGKSVHTSSLLPKLTLAGLIPWRFRDLYYLMNYRMKKDEAGLRRLAGIHRGWFRLAQSADIPVHVGPHNIDTEYGILPPGSVPEPLVSIPDAPLTGVRAAPTPLWKMDFVVRFLPV